MVNVTLRFPVNSSEDTIVITSLTILKCNKSKQVNNNKLFYKISHTFQKW